MLLIGSWAAKQKYRFVNRFPADVDLIATPAELDLFRNYIRPRGCIPISHNRYLATMGYSEKFEIEVAYPGSSAAKLLDMHEWRQEKLASRDIDDSWYLEETCKYLDVWVPREEVLYALKMSHRYLKNSPHFLKTMQDIKYFREVRGITKIPEEIHDWFKQREKETYTYPHPKLNKTKQDFFSGDGITYEFNHDDIHLAMAAGVTSSITGHTIPAYTLYKKDGQEVAIDKEKWDSCHYNIKLLGVREEVEVLALERSQLPYRYAPDRPSPQYSFNKALEKVCTSITSGFFREFAWENYDKVKEIYRSNYVDIFWQHYQAGSIRRV